LQAELATVKNDSAATWSLVPAPLQAAFLRVRAHPAVAEVERNQCMECHVTVTTSGMQALRKGEGVVYCENCGRILVIA
jgi:predicted  nucleic acid-binding Zn-ribbon protein